MRRRHRRDRERRHRHRQKRDLVHPRANLEKLALTGVGNLSGIGNAADNILTGNAGSNLLDGGAGPTGWPAERATTPTSSTTPATSSSRMQVRGRIPSAHDARRLHPHGERREPDLHGHRAFSGTGNAIANTHTGSAGADTLDGGRQHGRSFDTLIGGAGNDTYLVHTRQRRRHRDRRRRHRHGEGDVSYTACGQRREPDPGRHIRHQPRPATPKTTSSPATPAPTA